jgi:hypothetical protein
MLNSTRFRTLVVTCTLPVLLATMTGCGTKPTSVGLKKLAPGAPNAGFLSSYANLKPNPRFESTQSFLKQDDVKNIHKYFAVMIEPVEVYVATNADISKMPDRGRTALTAYFQHAITRAISDAFPVVHEPGPLVLRLRAALIGVDVGPDIPADQRGGEGGLERALDIGKVGVEIELVDSVTGEQIMAAIDSQNLGSGATVGSVSFSRDQKYAAAKEAFDGWAGRLRGFLDYAHELNAEEVQQSLESYRPYGAGPSGK